MAFSASSTFTVQNEIDKVVVFAEIEPLFNVGGYSTEPALTIATDVFAAICAVNFPHKWNQIELPFFYTNSWQQDYALVNLDGTSVLNVEWLMQGIAYNINASSVPKPWAYVECGRSLPKSTGAYGTAYVGLGCIGGQPFVVSSLPNYSLYYGTWGQLNSGSSTLGNNPVAGSIYTNPVGAPSMPSNPIMQIIDANGNFLVLTGFGIEGVSAPLAALNATPGTTASGTGATTIWTVVDPNGLGIRILDVPAQTGVTYQINISAQKTPPIFTKLAQTLAPLPDKYEPFFRAGFIAQCYRYSPETKVRAKFTDEWKMWLVSLQSLKALQDRELEEYKFVPQCTVMGRGGPRGRFLGGADPYGWQWR